METSKSLLAILFFLGFISASSAYVFTVGGRIGWVENPPVPYSSWSGSMRFSVNDTLVFNYKMGDSVLLVKKESYDSCNLTNPLQKLDSGIYKLDHSGPHYFISGAAGHCSNGEKLLVVVLAIRNPPSPPALAPPAPAPSSLSPSPSPASVTAPTPAPSSLSPSPASVTAPAPAPSSLSPSPSPASVTAPAPAPAPSSLSPSPSPASVTAPAPAPSSLSPSPSPSPVSVPAPGPSSVSPAPSSSSLSPSPGSVAVPSPPQPGSVPSGSPSGSLAPPPSANSSPVLRMSFGLIALVIGCTLMI